MKASLPAYNEVLNLAAAGLSNKRIALKLDLHEKTVKHHMGHIFQKLNVTNRTEAAMALRDAGHENHLVRECSAGPIVPKLQKL